MTLDDLARQAQFTAEGLLECAVTAVRERVSTHGKLSAAQTESVFGPLAAGWAQPPPLLRACELLADIWFHSEVAPSPTDLAELEKVTLLFPRSSRLISQLVVLDAQAGRLREATQLIDRALPQTDDEPSRVRLLKLRELVIAPK